MTVAIKTEIAGIREAVASLNKIEPGLRKQFAAELNQIAAPGRKNPSQLSTNLGRTPRPGRTRLFGPAVYSKIREVTNEIEQAALRVFNKVDRELR